MNSNLQKTCNRLLNYEYESSCISTNEYVMTYKENYYKISEFIHQILQECKKVKYLEDLQLNLKDGSAITPIALNEIITTTIIPVFNSSSKTENNLSNGFWMNRKVLNAQQTISAAKPLSFLFGKLFYTLLFIVSFLNIWLYYQSVQNIADAYVPQTYDVYAWIAAYLSLFILIFMHEVGHAAAAIKCGIMPRGIGMGFYTIMPAMYTDLTDIWKLNKSKKIKINLSGIFIQLLFNIGFLTSLYFIKNNFFLYVGWKIYYVNTFLVIINLIPFLKFDGYWILSDFFGLPNLIQQSNKLLVNLVTKKDPFEEVNQTKKNTVLHKILVIYTILRVAFIITIVYFVLAFIYTSILKTILLIKYIAFLEFDFETTIEIAKRVLTIIIITLFTRKYKKIFSSIIFKKIKWYKA